jgi:hypothetical protein
MAITKYAIPNPSNLFLEAITLIAKDVLGNLLIISFIFWNIRYSYEPGFRLSFVGEFNLKLLISVLLVTVGYFLWYHNSLGELVSKLPVGEYFEKFGDEIKRDYQRNPIPVISMVAVVVPICEEIIFRGMILRGLLARYQPLKAILLSALFFGAFHMNLPQFVNAFLIGLFLGYLYFKTHSLLFCISVHACNNAISFLRDSDTYQPTFLVFFIGALLFFFGFWSLWKLRLFQSGKQDQSDGAGILGQEEIENEPVITSIESQN